MIRKANNYMRGVKGTTELDTIRHKPHKQHRMKESQERIDTCLHCTKSASECKGDCFKKEKDEN